MKKAGKVLFFIVLIIGFIITSCSRKNNKEPVTLEFYKQYSQFTDPGKYAYLYKDLPESIPGLMKLIKSQLIHPDADLPLYRNEIPAERVNDDAAYPDVQSILSGLLSYNSSGLIIDRKPAQRLLLTCRFHSILLASILKSRGIPVRLRYGYATYLIPGYHVYHVVCEVWNKEESRWMLFDADRQKADIPKGQFEYASDVWEQFVNNKIKPELYGVPGWWGEHPIYSILCHDIASVLGEEYIYQNHPPICSNPYSIYKASTDQKKVLSKAALLLCDADRNFDKIKSIYEKNDFLKFKE
jgi:hypothetical protein